MKNVFESEYDLLAKNMYKEYDSGFYIALNILTQKKI